MKGFTAALMQFRISVSHVPDFEQTVPFRLGTNVSMNESHSWTFLLLQFFCLFIYSFAFKSAREFMKRCSFLPTSTSGVELDRPDL